MVPVFYATLLVVALCTVCTQSRGGVINEKQIKALTWVKDKRITLGNGLYLNFRKSSKTYIIRKIVNGRVTVTIPGKSPAEMFC